MKAKLYNIHATLTKTFDKYVSRVCGIFYNFAKVKNALLEPFCHFRECRNFENANNQAERFSF
jgi:hypothetical protein